jgi:hypothetical protein
MVHGWNLVIRSAAFHPNCPAPREPASPRALREATDVDENDLGLWAARLTRGDR